MGVEHDRVRVGLEWCGRGGSEGDAEKGLRLAGAMSYFWLSQSHLREGRRRVAAALAHVKAGAVGARWRAGAVHGAGLLAWAEGDYAAAGGMFEEALGMYRSLGDDAGVA